MYKILLSEVYTEVLLNVCAFCMCALFDNKNKFGGLFLFAPYFYIEMNKKINR